MTLKTFFSSNKENSTKTNETIKKNDEISFSSLLKKAEENATKKEKLLSKKDAIINAANELKTDLNTIQLKLKDSEERIEQLHLLNKKNHAEFQNQLLLLEQAKHQHKKTTTSLYQIRDNKSLLSYAINWTQTIFADHVMVKALPGSGTILFILPKGELRFVQFIYQNTPVHPIQQAFKEKLSPIQVHVFSNFHDFRDWMYRLARA